MRCKFFQQHERGFCSLSSPPSCTTCIVVKHNQAQKCNAIPGIVAHAETLQLLQCLWDICRRERNRNTAISSYYRKKEREEQLLLEVGLAHTQPQISLFKQALSGIFVGSSGFTGRQINTMQMDE